MCESHGFRITRVVCDQEPALGAMMGKLGGTLVVPVPKGSHVKRSERMIRLVKERVRATLNSLEYEMPLRCMRYLVMWAVQRINAMPRRGMGPAAANELFTGKKFDYAKDGAFAFGDFVVAPEPQTDNSMAPRARLCLVMCQRSNLSQNWVLLDIERGTTVTRAAFKLQPLGPENIARIAELAVNDKRVREIEQVDEVPIVPDVDERAGDVERMRGERLEHPEMHAGRAPVGNEEEVFAPEDHVLAPIGPREEEREPAQLAGQAAEHDADPLVVLEEPERPPNMRPPSARIAGRRVSVHSRVTVSHARAGYQRVVASHMFAAEASRKYGKKARESALAELREILDRGVFTPVSPVDALSKRKQKKMVKTFLFYKEKFNKNGELDRLKSRLVASDTSFESSLHPDKDSPTVRLESVLMSLAISGAEGRRLMSIDVGNAFLEASMDGEEVWIELDSWDVQHLLELKPDLKHFVDERGRISALLDRALYGCVQSAKLWYKKLRAVLESIGFVANRYDECVFNRDFGGKQLTVCVYVDDMLCSCVDLKGLVWLEEQLAGAFKKLTVKKDDRFEFVSLEIDQSGGGITIRMDKYIRSLLDEWGGHETNSSPAEKDLLKSDPASPKLDAEKSKLFHRRVARLLYLGKRVAPDIMLPVSVLAGKVNSPTLQDWERLDRVYRYLNGTANRCLQCWRGGKVSVCTFIDAAFACHDDMRSRTGCVLLCCGLCVGVWTAKQGQNVKSSTEAELIGLTDFITWVLWAQNFLEEQGYPPEPVVAYQDNTAVKDILKRGPTAQQRTRHLTIRHHFVGDLMKKNQVVIEYCETEKMLADMLTKALVGRSFEELRDRLVTIVI